MYWCTFVYFVCPYFNVHVNAVAASAIVSAKFNTMCQYPSAGWFVRSFVRSFVPSFVRSFVRLFDRGLMFFAVFNTNGIIPWRLVKLATLQILPVFTFLLNVSLTACFNVSVLKEAPQVVLMCINPFRNNLWYYMILSITTFTSGLFQGDVSTVTNTKKFNGKLHLVINKANVWN